MLSSVQMVKVGADVICGVFSLSEQQWSNTNRFSDYVLWLAC